MDAPFPFGWIGDLIGLEHVLECGYVMASRDEFVGKVCKRDRCRLFVDIPSEASGIIPVAVLAWVFRNIVKDSSQGSKIDRHVGKGTRFDTATATSRRYVTVFFR